MKNRSFLPPSGFTDTNQNLHNAASIIVKNVRAFFGNRQIKCSVWAYRYEDSLMLSCDITADEINDSVPITITATESKSNFIIWDEPKVFDLAEALHLCGIITKSLNANVVLGKSMNEVNPLVLATPLKEGETNGEIKLWR
ncbi:hypothetical protein [Lonsdalea quercina]|uniref:hypothetical protein n=1 Tax=Lonsdalea quercina TaxID=71657 RepID=UPI003976C7C7